MLKRAFIYLCLAICLYAPGTVRAADHIILPNITTDNWIPLVSSLSTGDRLIFRNTNTQSEQIYTLGPYVGQGAFGRVFRVAGTDNQIIKIAVYYRPQAPNLMSRPNRLAQDHTPLTLPENESYFIAEATELNRLDGTAIYHPQIFARLNNMALIKEYIEGLTLYVFLNQWELHTLETKTTFVHEMAKTATELQNKNIYFTDAGPANWVIQAETLHPYIIDPGRIQIRRDEILNSETSHITAFLNKAVTNSFAKHIIWAALLSPNSVQGLLRTESLIKALRTNPSQERLNQLMSEVQALEFMRADAPLTEGITNLRDYLARELHLLVPRLRGLQTTALNQYLCSSLLTQSN